MPFTNMGDTFVSLLNAPEIPGHSAYNLDSVALNILSMC